VYARVGSRAELSNALAERLADRLIVAGGTKVRDSRFDRATLAAFFRIALETIGEHRDLFLYVTRGAADDSAERTLFLAGKSAGPLAELLRRWRVAHGGDPAVAEPWAYGIIGMLNMVAMWWLDQGGRTAGELADQLAELVWSAMRGDP
jgi:AcrR family transcriptional regulator